MQTIGILGAGKLGITLAQIATKAGYQVLIASSKDPQAIALTIEVLAPTAQAVTSATAIAKSDVLILAMPLSHYKQVNRQAAKGKIIIDAMNYWWEVDGNRPELLDKTISTSELVQAYFKESIVIKALNHMGYHDLADESLLSDTANPLKKAIAIAGNQRKSINVVKKIIQAFGFDTVVLATLHDGIRLQPGTPAFGANVAEAQLRAMIATTIPGEFQLGQHN